MTDNEDRLLTAAVREHCNAATGLFAASKYQEIADCLWQAQCACERRDDLLKAGILEAARRICLACAAYQSDIAWCEKAAQRFSLQERELRQELLAILNVFRSEPAGGAAEPGRASTTVEGEGSLADALMATLKRLLGLPILQSADMLEGTAEIPGETAPAGGELMSESDVAADAQPHHGQASLRIYALGRFRAYQDDELITEWDGTKGLSLLKYLAVHYGKSSPRDVLMETFWPDAGEGAARRNLHQAIYSLRKTLRHRDPAVRYIKSYNSAYGIDESASVWIDFREFERRINAARQLESHDDVEQATIEYAFAERLYKGELLIEDRYDDWVEEERRHFEDLYFQAAERLSELYTQQGDYTRAVVVCQKMLGFDACLESAHRRLMQCYTLQGQPYLALRQYKICRKMLTERLGLDPSSATVDLYRRLTPA